MSGLVVEFKSALASYRLIRIDGSAKFVLEREETDAMGQSRFSEVNTWWEGDEGFEVMVFEAIYQQHQKEQA